MSGRWGKAWRSGGLRPKKKLSQKPFKDLCLVLISFSLYSRPFLLIYKNKIDLDMKIMPASCIILLGFSSFVRYYRVI